VIRPAVAAGHPATAAAGAEILRAGGNAADAAVAASLASCVAETIMTGLLGGAHAIHYDAGTGVARNLDCFVAVPSGEGAAMESLQVPFGEELVHYAVGASSCAVPGTVTASGEVIGSVPSAAVTPRSLSAASDSAAGARPLPLSACTCLAAAS